MKSGFRVRSYLHEIFRLALPGTFFKGYCEANSASFYIPFESHVSIGGPSTFLKNLRSYLDKNNYRYAEDSAHAKLILFPISYDTKILGRIKERGGIICQRLDGVYYPEKHGQNYKDRNEKIRKIYVEYADHVIFQSEYSRRQCFDMFGEKNEDEYTIITNGVDTELFYPKRDGVGYPRRDCINMCTTGNFRNPDMLVPVFNALDLLDGVVPFRLHVVGPVKDRASLALMNRKYVVDHGSCDLGEVAELLRGSDVYIYSHLNPPCPNSVLEAIATGLPVVGFNSGAMAELLPFSVDLLADAGGGLYQSMADFDPKKLADKIVLAIDNYQYYREISLKNCGVYSLDNCGRKYMEIIRRLLDSSRE